jgi:hypothetical protein
MARIIEIARNIAAVMSPATGVRSTGKITIRRADETTTDEKFVPNGVFALGQIDGVIRQNLVFRVTGGVDEFVLPVSNVRQKPKVIKGWRIPENSPSREIEMTSIVGGVRHNIASGELVFDPGVPGVSPECEITTPFTGGTDPTHFGGVKSVALFESLPGGSINLNLFRSEVGEFPAVVLVWDNTEPADGSTIAQTDRATRTGSTTVEYKETFDILIVSKRLDSDHFRRSEGLQILDDVSALISDRKAVDGVPFSNPSGLQIRQRNRILGNEPTFQDFYIYRLQVSAMAAISQVDDRQFATWCEARMTFKGCDDVDREQDPITVAGPIHVIMTPTLGLAEGSSEVSGTLNVS